MKVARLARPGHINIIDEPTPAPGSGEVLVEVRSVGLCGSDRHYMRPDSHVHGPNTAALVMGHEASGVVAELGPDVADLEVAAPVAIEPALPCRICRWCQIGRPNVCPHTRFLGYPPTDGAMRQAMVLPAANVIPVGSDLSFDQIMMAEPLAVAVYAMDCAAAWRAESAAVIGCGSIGLMLVQLLARQGVRPLLATDVFEHKLGVARSFGASHAVDASTEDVVAQARTVAPLGFDVVFEIAGAPDTPSQAVELASPAGCVVMGGINSDETITYHAATARRRGVTVVNLRRSNHTTERAIRLVESGAIDVASLVTHHFGIEALGEAFTTFLEYRDDVIKVAIDPTSP